MRTRNWILAAYVLLYVPTTMWLAFNSSRYADNQAYYYAVQVLFDGGNPYDIRELWLASDATVGNHNDLTPFLYPPTALLLMSWMAWLEPDQVRPILAGMSHLVLIATFHAQRRRGERWEVVMLLLMLWWPSWFIFLKGQVSLLVLSALMAIVYARSGTAIALGGLLKISPAGLLVWVVSCRDRKVVRQALIAIVLGLLGIGLSVALLGDGLWLTYVNDTLPLMRAGDLQQLGLPQTAGGIEKPNVQAIFLHLPMSQRAVEVASSVVKWGLLIVWVICARRPSKVSAGALVAIMIFCNPISWTAHLTLMLLPAYQVVYAWRKGRLSAWWKVWAATGLVYIALNREWLEPVIWYIPEWTWFYQLLPAFGMLCFVATTLHLTNVASRRTSTR